MWSGGLFYSRLSENVPENIYDPTLNQEVINYTGGAASVCYAGQECPGGLIFNRPVDSFDKQVAVFGELTFKFPTPSRQPPDCAFPGSNTRAP